MNSVHPDQSVQISQPTGFAERAWAKATNFGQRMTTAAVDWTKSKIAPHQEKIDRLSGKANKIIAKVKDTALQVKDGVSKPIQVVQEHIRYYKDPAESSLPTLEKIDRVAKQVLERSQAAGINPSATADLEFLKEAEPVSPWIQPSLAEEKARNEVEIKQETTEFSKKYGSALTVLCQMEYLCEKKSSISKLMEIAKKSAEENGDSVWKLFTSQNNLSLFQKAKAGFFYLVFYKTGFISNIIETYINSSIHYLTTAVSNESGSVKSAFYQKLLTHIHRFLLADAQAHERFANGQENGDLDECRKREIESHLSQTTEDSIQTTIFRLIDEASPTVPFFKPKLKNIPILGALFKLIEKIANRYIREKMKQILPGTLKSGLDSGVALLKNPDYLRFTLKITTFLKDQLLELQKAMQEGQVSAPSQGEEEPISGTDLLPTVIKQLEKAFHLSKAETKTPEDIKKQITDWQGKSIIDKGVEGAIRGTLIKQGNNLFRYFDKMIQSRKLFAMLLERTNSLFKGPSKTEQQLKDEYKTEVKALEEIADAVFVKAVHDGVETAIFGAPVEDKNKPAVTSFEDKLETIHKTLEELQKISNGMLEKSNQPEPIDVQIEIANFAKILESFANHSKIKSIFSSEEEDALRRDAIDRLLTPIYKKIAEIQKQILNLQIAQNRYNQTKNIQETLRKMQTNFEECLQVLDWKKIEKAQTLFATLEATSSIVREMAPSNARILEFREQLTHDQKLLDSLEFLSSQRENPLQNPLKYLEDYYQPGFKISLPYKYSQTIQKIREHLSHFPDEERQALENLIGNGSNLRANKEQLNLYLEALRTNYSRSRDTTRTALDIAIRENIAKIQTEYQYEELDRVQQRNLLTEEMQDISLNMNNLQLIVRNSKLDLSPTLTHLGAAVGKTGWGLGAVAAATTVGVISSPWTLGIGAVASSIPSALLLGQTSVHTYGFNKTYPKVDDLFKQALKYMRDPIIFEAAKVRFFEAFTEPTA